MLHWLKGRIKQSLLILYRAVYMCICIYCFYNEYVINKLNMVVTSQSEITEDAVKLVGEINLKTCALVKLLHYLTDPRH